MGIWGGERGERGDKKNEHLCRAAREDHKDK